MTPLAAMRAASLDEPLLTTLRIGGDRCSIEGPFALHAALAARYAGFVAEGEDTAAIEATLRISLADRFAGDYAAPARLEVRLSGDTLSFEGEATGEIDLVAGRGTLSRVEDLGPIDAAVRAWIATRAPLRGVLPLHGMIAPVPGGALVLVGASGAGKSTAARLLGAVCDELVAISEDGTCAVATPYWGGRPYAAPLVAIGVLSRSCHPRIARLGGSAAMRLLAPHVIRYVAYPPAERAILQLLGRIAERSVWRLDAPVGAEFPAFVAQAATRLGADSCSNRGAPIEETT